MDLNDSYEKLFDKLDEYIENPVTLTVFGGMAVSLLAKSGRPFVDIDVIGSLPKHEAMYIPFIAKEVLGKPHMWLDLSYNYMDNRYLVADDYKKRIDKIIYEGSKLHVELAGLSDVIDMILMGIWLDVFQKDRLEKAYKDLLMLGGTCRDIYSYKDKFRKFFNQGYETMVTEYEKRLRVYFAGKS